MEMMYQRSKIQEESLEYERQKHSGDLPIIGVNTFLGKGGSPTIIPDEVIRSTPEERAYAIDSKEAFMRRNSEEATAATQQLRQAAVRHENIFAALMEAARYCSLGQMSAALYGVGGQYRRNM